MTDGIHLGKNGPAKCPTKKQCRLKNDDGTPATHYENWADAGKSFDKQMEDKYGKFASMESEQSEGEAGIATNYAYDSERKDKIASDAVSDLFHAPEINKEWIEEFSPDDAEKVEELFLKSLSKLEKYKDEDIAGDEQWNIPKNTSNDYRALAMSLKEFLEFPEASPGWVVEGVEERGDEVWEEEIYDRFNKKLSNLTNRIGDAIKEVTEESPLGDL